MFNFSRKRFRHNPYIVIDSTQMLKDYFHFNIEPTLIEDDLHEVRFIEDVNDRRFVDAYVLSLVAANNPGPKLDIGTHRGRSAARMAANSKKDLVYTVNISPEQAHDAGILITEILPIQEIGVFYKSKKLKNIHQIFANTKTWIIPPDISGLSLVYIDGSHDAEFVYRDTVKIFDRVKPGGFILWHDCSPLYRNNFLWINESMTGIDKLIKNQIIKGYILNLRNSWIGIWRKV